MTKLQFQLSADTRFCVQTLREAKIGDVIAYAALEEATGRGRHEIRYAIASARRVLLREEDMVFAHVKNVGLKRLSDHEIVQTADATAVKIKRTARRGARVLTAVANFSKLTRQDQMKHSASVSVFSTIAEMTTTRRLLRVEKAVEDTRKELPFAQTLDAFKS